MINKFITWLKEPFLKVETGEPDWIVISAVSFLVILILVMLNIMANIG